jgi:hypothetical protein
LLRPGFLLNQAVADGQRDQGLAQDVFMAAGHGLHAAAAGSLSREFQLLTGEGGQ